MLNTLPENVLFIINSYCIVSCIETKITDVVDDVICINNDENAYDYDRDKIENINYLKTIKKRVILTYESYSFFNKLKYVIYSVMDSLLKNEEDGGIKYVELYGFYESYDNYYRYIFQAKCIKSEIKRIVIRYIHYDQTDKDLYETCMVLYKKGSFKQSNYVKDITGLCSKYNGGYRRIDDPETYFKQILKILVSTKFECSFIRGINVDDETNMSNRVVSVSINDKPECNDNYELKVIMSMLCK